MKDGDRIGLLVMSYGTARDLDDVEAYYTHIRRGSPPPPDLLEELKDRYRAIGGRSPLTEITERQIAGLEQELNDAAGGRTFLSFNGQKHQRPYIEDAVAAMGQAGLRRAVGLVLAPHYSRFSVGQYVERARAAAEPLGIETTFVDSYARHPAFVAFVADRVREALGGMSEATVVFSAHSLPARIVEAGDPYPEELTATADAVAAEVGLPADRLRVAWMSAGRTPEPWLGPGISDVIGELAGDGVESVVIAPVGFVADHLEVLYDVDIEAAATAQKAGVRLARTRSPNDDPAFLRVLAPVVREHLAAEGWI
jgi:ferrochelatase